MDGVVIVLAVLLGVILSAVFMAYKDRNFRPPKVEIINVEEVDGVFIGKYYGDPESKICVEVLAVEDGIVAFKHLEDHVNSMPKEAFLEKYYKYPNGCEFPEIDRN